MQNEECGAHSFNKYIFYAQIAQFIWCIVEIQPMTEGRPNSWRTAFS